MRKSQGKAATNVDIGNTSGIYHFHYDARTAEDDSLSLEYALFSIDQHLKSQLYDKEQCADLIVIGVGKNGKRYVINQPSDAALDKLTAEYGQREAPKHKFVKNSKLSKIIVRNMVDSGPMSVVLEGEIICVTTNGYATLVLEQFDANTKELGKLMTEMIKLRLLRINSRVSLQHLRQAYRGND